MGCLGDSSHPPGKPGKRGPLIWKSAGSDVILKGRATALGSPHPDRPGTTYRRHYGFADEAGDHAFKPRAAAAAPRPTTGRLSHSVRSSPAEGRQFSVSSVALARDGLITRHASITICFHGLPVGAAIFTAGHDFLRRTEGPVWFLKAQRPEAPRPRARYLDLKRNKLQYESYSQDPSAESIHVACTIIAERLRRSAGPVKRLEEIFEVRPGERRPNQYRSVLKVPRHSCDCARGSVPSRLIKYQDLPGAPGAGQRL